MDSKHLASDPESKTSALLGVDNGMCGFRFGNQGDLTLDSDVELTMPIDAFLDLLWAGRERHTSNWGWYSVELLRQKITNQLPGIWRA